MAKKDSILIRFVVVMYDNKKLFHLKDYDDLDLYVDTIDASWFEVSDTFAIKRNDRNPICRTISFYDGTDETPPAFDFGSTWNKGWFTQSEARVAEMDVDDFKVGDIIEIVTAHHYAIDDFAAHVVKYLVVMFQREDKLNHLVRSHFGIPTDMFNKHLLEFLVENGEGNTLILI